MHGERSITTDQLTTFEYPDTPGAEQKEVAIVSSAPHLAGCVLHIAEQYRPFRPGSVPYAIPVGEQNRQEFNDMEGGKTFALMEARGLLYYIYKAKAGG